MNEIGLLHFMTPSKYTFSFTGASVLMAETQIIAAEYYRLKDWHEARRNILENNLMNKVKQTTLQREFNEIKKRLSELTPDQWILLTQGNSDEVMAMIFLSLVKTYRYVNDFLVEVVRTKFYLYDYVLTDSDYIRFYNSKVNEHPELESLTETTAIKVRNVLFRMLQQTHIISDTKHGIITRPMLSQRAEAVIIQDHPAWLAVFLYSDHEIKTLAHKPK